MKLKRLIALAMCALMLISLAGNVLAESGIELAEPTVVVCNECGAEVGHNEECSLFANGESEGTETAETEPAVEPLVDGGHTVGQKVYIKIGTTLYKDYQNSDADTYVTWLMNHYVTITEVIEDENGNAEWYEFEGDFTLKLAGWSTGYVHVDNTSVEEPTDPSDPSEPTDPSEPEPTDPEPSEPEEPGKEVVVERTSIKIEGNVPDSVTLSASTIDKDKLDAVVYDFNHDNTEILFGFDITLTNPDGSVWQPADGETVTVTISLDASEHPLPDGNTIGVLHEHNGVLRDLGKTIVEDQKLVFEVDGFSNFYFYIEFSFGGYQYTMSGNSEMYLSELMNALGISRSVNEVSSVTFSNPEVLEITKEGSDWLLSSLAPFGSNEILTIVFNDGETIEIDVKDPVVYNYALGSDITKVPKLETKTITMGEITDGDKSSQGESFVVNSNVITNANIKDAAGSAGETNTTVNIVIYAREGMAIGFEAGTEWYKRDSEYFSRPTKGSNGVWYWSWDGKINYAVVDDNAAGKQAVFKIKGVVDNVKYYCNIMICVIDDSEPVLLEKALESSDLTGYSIKTVPATLYNYDGKTFNKYYDNMSGPYFAFSGYSKGVKSTADLINHKWTTSNKQANGGGGVALMGIVKDTLVNGLPEMSQGQKVDVFSTNAVPGKEVFSNVQFQLVYNENTGYYLYNSALNHAQYNETTKEVELYQQSLAPSDTPVGGEHGNAGFYPFEDINEAYTNTGYTEMKWADWANKLEEQAFELTPSQYSTDIVQTSASDSSNSDANKRYASTADMHFGLQIASEFYLPEGKQLNGKDMIFEFTGDDDLWVFIDGKLVLDIGGGHTHVSGRFNMRTGEVWVEKYSKLSAADGGSYATAEAEYDKTNLEYTDKFLVGLKEDQMHTIQIFYLERHGGVSNCMLRFNLPLAPSNSVYVSKNLTSDSGADLTVTPDVEYTFALFTAVDDNDDIDATVFSALANYIYTVMGPNAPEGHQTTGADGKFTLKDGQTAVFEGIDRFYEVYAVEYEPSDEYIYTKTTVSVNKNNASQYEFDTETEKKVVQKDSSIFFDFINYMKTQPLVIEKEVYGGNVGLIDSQQQYTFALDITQPILETGSGEITAYDNNNDAVSLTDGGQLLLRHGETVELPCVPVNMSYALNESNPDAQYNSFDNPIYTLTIGEGTGTAETLDFSVNFKKAIMDGGENRVKVFNRQRISLTITKQITDSPNPEQAFVFNVKGERLDVNLVIPVSAFVEGKASIVLKNMDVGEYTVTEITDWSWRYDLTIASANRDSEAVFNKDNCSLQFDLTSAGENVTFTNTRTEEKWLSGDSYAKNLFNGVDPNATDNTDALPPKKDDDED